MNNSLKLSNYAGFDGISSGLLKTVASTLSRPWSFLVNSSIIECKLSSILKSAIVKPLYKKGSRLDKNNYRPIYILSTFSKILEKLLLNRLNSFLIDSKVLFEKQFGFRKHTSTVDAMYSFLSSVSKALVEHDSVLGMFLDLSKAFDMVNHKLLLKKFDHFGIRGNALGWISSYLEARTQTVEFPCLDANGCISLKRSSEIVVTCRVPQGSVLDYIRFLLFVNDINSSVANVDLCFFADDTSLNIKNSSRDNLEIE